MWTQVVAEKRGVNMWRWPYGAGPTVPGVCKNFLPRDFIPPLTGSIINVLAVELGVPIYS